MSGSLILRGKPFDILVMNIRIYTLTHKNFTQPTDDMYVPLQVGAALHDSLGYLQDDTGDNISAKNIYYSELTGHYWIWKNVSDIDYVGTCHYRRYLMNDNGGLLTASQIMDILSHYDVITTKRVHLNNSYHYGFSAHHNGAVLDLTGEVIRDLYPEDYDNFITMVHDDYTHFSNMLIASKNLFNSYCEWLFTIFAEVENRTNLDTDEDSYHKRVLGFISEFLLGVWMRGRSISSYECKVAVMCEKKEVTETKTALGQFFAIGDVQGAKAFFLDAIKKRPDIMQEASDITGELRLCMQIISTCEYEDAESGSCILDKINRFEELIPYFTNLNNLVQKSQSENYVMSPEEEAILASYSPQAVKVSTALFAKVEQKFT